MNWDQICGQIPDSDNVQKMAYLNELDFIKIFVMKPENGMCLYIFEIIYVLLFYWPKSILNWSNKFKKLQFFGHESKSKIFRFVFFFYYRPRYTKAIYFSEQKRLQSTDDSSGI